MDSCCLAHEADCCNVQEKNCLILLFNLSKTKNPFDFKSAILNNQEIVRKLKEMDLRYDLTQFSSILCLLSEMEGYVYTSLGVE